MRSIQVSTFVFSAIWSSRQEGEETENEILERLLRKPTDQAARFDAENNSPAATGFSDPRYNVVFPEGMEIVRTYKGKVYRAIARRGAWYINNVDKPFHSLNALSREVASGPENAWINWFFIDQDNVRRPISSLRDQARIPRKGRGIAFPEKENGAGGTNHPDTLPTNLEAGVRDMTWFQTIVEALNSLRGKAPLFEIYKAVARIRREKGLSTPSSLEAIVRRELENNSSDSENYTGHRDAFYLPEGKGAGVWALRSKYLT